MSVSGRATAFVTGAAGFIGTELVKVLVAGGHQVFGLTRSFETAERLGRAGAVAIVGDLLQPGQWQDVAAADWVFHLPPHPFNGQRVTRRRAASIAGARLLMDEHLLGAVASSATQRIVYVADTFCYAATGLRPVTEDELPRRSAWGRWLTPALDRLDGYVIAGLPIRTALPGWVYGDGSWFRRRVVEPVVAGRPVLQFGKNGPWVSPIHVHDCARALVHIAEHGAAGGRYFVVNSDPIRLHAFPETFARLATRQLRVWRMPRAAAGLVVGRVLADCATTDRMFSNIRLRGTGFRFNYPTLEGGIQQVVGALRV